MWQRAALILIVLLLLAVGRSMAFVERETEAPDIFVRDDIVVGDKQKAGRVLAAGAHVTVAGVVEKGVVIVDGGLSLTASAHVKGPILVLGGEVNREAGARAERAVLVLAPVRMPFAGVVVSGLVILALVSAAALPLAVWVMLRLLNELPVYLRLRKEFFFVLQRRPALYMIVTLAISAMMLIFFTEMAWKTMFRQQMEAVDNLFIWLVRYFAKPSLDRVMIVLSDLGSGYLFGAVVMLALLTLGFYRRWLEAAGLFICLNGALVLNVLLKHLFERGRPELFRVVEASGYSFPSGHAMVSLCFYGLLAFLAARRLSCWRWRIAVAAAAVLLVGAIGVSRVYLGVHYPTDVAAGYMAGGMWLAFCISLLMWRESNL